MTTILKLKKNFYSLIGITLLIIFSQTIWAANPTADCAVSAAGVVTQTPNGRGTEHDCFAPQPHKKLSFIR